MELITRTIKVSANQNNNLLQVRVSQIDNIIEPAMQYEFRITGTFDEDLVLKALHVDKMEGSMGAICTPAKVSLQTLLGVQVGKGFTKRVRQLSGPDFCMHFPAMLQQMASTALRFKQIKILQSEGKTAFLRANKILFKGRCVGYSS
jgi:hypothetical protein